MSDKNSKVALVTGSATGIGRACALRFAENGFHVVVNYSKSEADARETLKLVEACHVQGLLVQCDVGNDAAVRDMLHTVEGKFGRLDVLVNNAGAFARAPLDQVSEEDWDRVFAVNCKGTFLCSVAAARRMGLAQSGAIVNIAGASAHRH